MECNCDLLIHLHYCYVGCAVNKYHITIQYNRCKKLFHYKNTKRYLVNDNTYIFVICNPSVNLVLSSNQWQFQVHLCSELVHAKTKLILLFLNVLCTLFEINGWTAHSKLFLNCFFEEDLSNSHSFFKVPENVIKNSHILRVSVTVFLFLRFKTDKNLSKSIFHKILKTNLLLSFVILILLQFYSQTNGRWHTGEMGGGQTWV